MTETTPATTRAPVSIQLIGGLTDLQAADRSGVRCAGAGSQRRPELDEDHLMSTAGPSRCTQATSTPRTCCSPSSAWLITPGHGDHFFGLNTIIAAFPAATAVTAAAVAPDAQGRASPGDMQFWTATIPGQIPGYPAVTVGVDGDVIVLEGRELSVITVGQSGAVPSMIVERECRHRRRCRLRGKPPEHRHDHPNDPARTHSGRDRATGRKVSQVAAVTELTNGRYLVEVSETELALLKTALEQAERVSRFGIEILDGADQASDGRRVENTRLRREIQALALQEASLRSLQRAMAGAEPGEEAA